jgi:hypothetical protein
MNFIEANDFSVGLVLRVMGIPASIYYDCRKARPEPSQRARQDAELLRLIDEIRSEDELARMAARVPTCAAAGSTARRSKTQLFAIESPCVVSDAAVGGPRRFR